MKQSFRVRCFVLLVAGWASSGCSTTPPPNWARGGAPVTMTSARWNRADSVIEIRTDGKVLRDGHPFLGIDAAGRVFETDGDPIALLEPDGNLVGNDRTAMGHVGAQSAAFPGSTTAWVTIGPRGEVTRYDSDGERIADGFWQGCTGAALQTCTLVTHMALLRDWERRPHVGIGIGIGVMMH